MIVASGELDAAKAPELEKVLTQLLSGGAKKQLVLDLKGIGFIDSSGLATLVRAFKRARSAGGNLALADLQPAVQKVFELTRLDKAFDVFRSSADAIQRLAS